VLVRDPGFSARQALWEGAGRRVLEHADGFLRVLGGPGTGKSTLIADAVAERILRREVRPENVLVLTASRPAANRMRRAITRRLTAESDAPLRTAREPLVRTVHSYAFAVLRWHAISRDLPPPSMLNGPDQDALVRELLEGDVEAGAQDWPAPLRPALLVPGFAEELRDLLLCAAERGVGPEDLIELGARHDRPEWSAAGRFGRQYEQVTLLRGGTTPQESAPALDAAELVSAALLAFEDPDLLSSERQRVRYLFVDDAQHLDPQQFWLVRRLGDTAAEFVLAGDPDQAIFSFRGADAHGLLDADPEGANTEVLSVDHRMSLAVRTAVREITARLPGTGPQRRLAGSREDPGSVEVRLLGSQAQEAAWVADGLRRAHLLDEVPWSRMAVVVRSTGLALPVLRRALLAAGVPLRLPAEELPLAQRPAVRPLLTLLRCAARSAELTPDTAEELLASALGGADPLALRRLRRGLRRLELSSGGDRRSGDLLVEVLLRADLLAALEDSAVRPAHRVAALLEAASRSIADGDAVERTLWEVWQSSGLEQRWLAQAQRGGVTGAQADRDLDAVVALFDAAAQYADRLPGGDVAGFVDALTRQHIVGSSLAPSAPQEDAVAVLTAHATAGQEWEVVAIPGVQEGVWPDLRPRGSLLRQDLLIDVLSGVDGSRQVSATAPRLADERRLFLVAASRARRGLLVSAVRGDEEQPSRFVEELADAVTPERSRAQPRAESPERGLVLAELVGELRQVVCDPEQPRARRERAATHLARLATAGVPGAHPSSWYGLPESSTEMSLVADGDPVRVSPSTVDVLTKCPLRWVIERHGGQDVAELSSVTGTLVHALVQAAAEGAQQRELYRMLDEAWHSVDAGAPWFSRKERERVRGMLDAFLAWLAGSRSELTQVGAERDLDMTVPAREGGPWIRLRGRVDRLEADSEGRPVVVDVKTAKTPVSHDDAEEHPQLAVYQLAAALGAFQDSGRQEPGGARLLYVAKPEARTGAATERAQDALDRDRIRVWLDVLHGAAESSVGPAFVATENPDCPRCPAKTCCPVHPAGRQVGP
jgi:superfamily I DNA/RNA helicase/RecB family exonuclease